MADKRLIMISIREAKKQDYDNIYEVYLKAFSNEENKNVASLASSLLNEETIPCTMALVAEKDGAIAGHIAFSPITFYSSTKLIGYILSPLAVKPEYQNCGIGSKLIGSCIAQLSYNGVNVLFVYGDPKYYSKFGFKAETAAKYLPPYQLQYPSGWLARILNGEDSNENIVKISCVASLHDPALW